MFSVPIPRAVETDAVAEFNGSRRGARTFRGFVHDLCRESASGGSALTLEKAYAAAQKRASDANDGILEDALRSQKGNCVRLVGPEAFSKMTLAEWDRRRRPEFHGGNDPTLIVASYPNERVYEQFAYEFKEELRPIWAWLKSFSFAPAPADPVLAKTVTSLGGDDSLVALEVFATRYYEVLDEHVWPEFTKDWRPLHEWMSMCGLEPVADVSSEIASRAEAELSVMDWCRDEIEKIAGDSATLEEWARFAPPRRAPFDSKADRDRLFFGSNVWLGKDVGNLTKDAFANLFVESATAVLNRGVEARETARGMLGTDDEAKIRLPLDFTDVIAPCLVVEDAPAFSPSSENTPDGKLGLREAADDLTTRVFDLDPVLASWGFSDGTSAAMDVDLADEYRATRARAAASIADLRAKPGPETREKIRELEKNLRVVASVAKKAAKYELRLEAMRLASLPQGSQAELDETDKAIKEAKRGLTEEASAALAREIFLQRFRLDAIRVAEGDPASIETAITGVRNDATLDATEKEFMIHEIEEAKGAPNAYYAKKRDETAAKLTELRRRAGKWRLDNAALLKFDAVRELILKLNEVVGDRWFRGTDSRAYFAIISRDQPTRDSDVGNIGAAYKSASPTITLSSVRRDYLGVAYVAGKYFVPMLEKIRAALEDMRATYVGLTTYDRLLREAQALEASFARYVEANTVWMARREDARREYKRNEMILDLQKKEIRRERESARASSQRKQRLVREFAKGLSGIFARNVEGSTHRVVNELSGDWIWYRPLKDSEILGTTTRARTPGKSFDVVFIAGAVAAERVSLYEKTRRTECVLERNVAERDVAERLEHWRFLARTLDSKRSPSASETRWALELATADRYGAERVF